MFCQLLLFSSDAVSLTHVYTLFSYYLPSYCITSDWIEFPVLYSRTSLLIHSKRNSLHSYSWEKYCMAAVFTCLVSRGQRHWCCEKCPPSTRKTAHTKLWTSNIWLQWEQVLILWLHLRRPRECYSIKGGW